YPGAAPIEHCRRRRSPVRAGLTLIAVRDRTARSGARSAPPYPGRHPGVIWLVEDSAVTHSGRCEQGTPARLTTVATVRRGAHPPLLARRPTTPDCTNTGLRGPCGRPYC